MPCTRRPAPARCVTTWSTTTRPVPWWRPARRRAAWSWVPAERWAPGSCRSGRFRSRSGFHGHEAGVLPADPGSIDAPWCCGRPALRGGSAQDRGVPLGRARDRLVVVDHLVDDEGEELLGEDRIQSGIARQALQPGDLLGLTLGVGGGHTQLRLEPAYCLGALEAFGEDM